MKPTAASVAPLVLCCFLAACGNPANWSEAKVEKWVRGELELTAVSLAEQPDGTLAGEGRTELGGKIRITVERRPETKELWYRATDEEGNVEAGGLKRH